MNDLSSIIDNEYRKILAKEIPLAEYIPSEEMYISLIRTIRRKVIFRRTLLVAAVVCPILFLLYSTWYMHENFGVFDKSRNEYLVESGCGDRVQTIFQDCSKVHLNAGSKLKYPDKFGIDSREVYLEGEAYFEVSPDSKRPFVVNFSDGSVRVYGTKFNLKAYPGDDDFVVSLDEGSVKVATAGGEYPMVPSDILVCNRKTGNVTIFHDNNPARNSLWRHNLISFRNGTLNQVCTQLSRIYGVDFIFQGHIPDYKFTFTTEKESLPNILSELEFISSLKFERVSDTTIVVTNR